MSFCPTPLLVLAAGIGSLAAAANIGSLTAAANARSPTNLTNCAASTVTTVSATEELTVMSVNTKGITRSNSANKAFDNATFECASVGGIVGAQRNGTRLLQVRGTQQRLVVGRQVLNSDWWRKMGGCRVGKIGKGVSRGGAAQEVCPAWQVESRLLPGRGRVVSGRPVRTNSQVVRIG